jgi:hypothetical protein
MITGSTLELADGFTGRRSRPGCDSGTQLELSFAETSLIGDNLNLRPWFEATGEVCVEANLYRKNSPQRPSA